MIMKLAQWITAPFSQPVPRGTSVPAPAPAPALPVALGHDDTVMIFRAHLTTLADGEELRASLDRMVRRAPRVASQVIFAASLGEVSRGRAVRSLRDYLITATAVAPLGL